MSRSISDVDLVVGEGEPEVSPEPSLRELADMLFLVFCAVKDLEARFDEHFSS
ncbi:hypothetical protein UFOVP536_4 [uncultured Caudovirales phage]|uniref:Uncharacterized protein n=1 Tax=uncultured Caudovirales phage TaxID=2100421 RepID=A0A6J5MPA3_9CAUD|nr:hypothetical protein UFOVP536_4 [uncultured Caudovirales phage]